MKNKAFWASKTGKLIITVVCYAIIWGLILALGSSETNLAWFGILPCAYFGWKSLNKIQPTMFLWLSFVGWIVYFFVKLMLSVVVGLFVAPYYIGRWLAEKLADGLIQNNSAPLLIMIGLGIAIIVTCAFLLIPSRAAKSKPSKDTVSSPNSFSSSNESEGDASDENSEQNPSSSIPSFDDIVVYDFSDGESDPPANSSDSLTTDDSSPFQQQYWVIFTEGFRNDRIEASTFDSPLPNAQLKIIWDSALEIGDSVGASRCNQYYLDDNGKWVYIGNYHRLSDKATNVLASNLDVFDRDGNVIIPRCSYSMIDWNKNGFSRMAPQMVNPTTSELEPGPKDILSACPPYQTSEYEVVSSATICGETYSNGFYMNRYGYALYNLGGKYNKLSFDVGHIDGTDMLNGSIEIYLDGELSEVIDINAEDLIKHYEIDLHDAKQMKIYVVYDPYGMPQYGFVNVVIS